MQDMAFNLQDFYYNILFLFEDEDDNNWASETLAYWNRYVTCVFQINFVTVYGLCRHFFPPNGRSHNRKCQEIPSPSNTNDLVKLRNERGRRHELALANLTLEDSAFSAFSAVAAT